MIPVWPASLRQQPRRNTWIGGPLDLRRRFAPDRGEDQFRRATTAEVMVFDGVVFPNLDDAQRETFLTFFREDLENGALPFAWADPVTGENWLWRIAGDGRLAFSLTAKGAGNHDLTLSLIRRPGRPWWSRYAPSAISAVPALVADFAAGVYGVQGARRSLASLVSVTRSGTATRVNEAGLVVPVAANALRLDHDPVTLACRGLLVEPARTNLCLRSSEFSTSPWTLTNASVIANDATAPDGAATADRITVTAAIFPRTSQSVTLATGDHAISLYAKAGTAGFLHGTVELGGNVLRFFVNLSTGAVQTTVTGSWGSPVFTAEPAGNGWYRLVLTCTIAAAGSHTLFVGPSNALGSTSGTVGQSVLLWGAQVEAGAFATSLIPTAAATVARGAETAIAADAAFASLTPDGGGSMVRRLATAGVGLTGPIAYAAWPAGQISLLAGSAADRRHVARAIAFREVIPTASLLDLAA